MKFDVIIGNPPFHKPDGGHNRSAVPLYHHFIAQAKRLQPRYIVMIVPSRWFTSGRGLDKFRRDMLNDPRIRALVDIPNAKSVFPDMKITGGVCYFVWDRNHNGPCEVTTVTREGSVTASRALNEFPVFLRFTDAASIVRAVLRAHTGPMLSSTVLPDKPFGIQSNYRPRDHGIPCLFKNHIGLRFADPRDVTDRFHILHRWKVVVSKIVAVSDDFSRPNVVYHERNTAIVPPGVCCSQTWIVAGVFNTEQEARAFRSYLLTKTVRFLVLQATCGKNAPRGAFRFVPNIAPYEGEYTDAALHERWGITDAAAIDKYIRDAAAPSGSAG